MFKFKFPFSKKQVLSRNYNNISVEPKDNLTLWYINESSENYKGWEEDALPIGNGDIGCKIYGGARREHIQFNEKSLWTGDCLGVNGCDNGNAKGDCGKSLKDIQELLENGKYTEAEKNMKKLQGDEIGLGAYQNFGDIYIDFIADKKAEISSYVRSLDLKTAVSRVEYKINGSDVTREYFVSYPDNTAVFKFTGNNISIKFTVENAHKNGKIKSENDTYTLVGSLGADPLNYAAAFKFVTDGKMTVNGKSVEISNAQNIEIYSSYKTDYGYEYPKYRDNIDVQKFTLDAVNKAVQKGYDKVINDHINDYQKLFSRVELDIGQTVPSIPTDMLLYKYQKGEHSRALENLFFQYGRYLLISSSRIGGLPANLQGVWNAKNNPEWQSDYHLNINLQMNYFPALVTNIEETVPPLIKYVNKCLVVPGRATAHKFVGVGDGDVTKPTGWMAHTQNNIFGHTGAGSVWTWGWAPTTGAFILENMFEYYLFTKDIDVLANDIYPSLEEHALMWSQLLIEDKKTDRLVCSPGFSPEHGPVSIGNSFDQQLIWELFNNTILGSEALVQAGKENLVNAELIEKIKSQITRLKPIQIGKWGQIKEWIEEDEWKDRGFISHRVEKGHRHTSHLMGLYPGSLFNKDDKKAFNAAKVSLNDRGNQGQGWSKALKICEWARLLDGNRAHLIFEEQLKNNTHYNLWDFHPPYQIDGNFGATAGVAEMLIQSHTDAVHILPALPSCWAEKGEFKGLVARGNFVVDCKWENGRAVYVKIHSKIGGKCKLIVNDKEQIIDTEQNEKYVLEV